LLDKQLKAASPLVLPSQPSVTDLPLDRAMDIVRDAFTVAGERDIYTGDQVEIWMIKKDGIVKEVFELKKD
jgi:20S proteasome subunit beta 6